VRDKGGKTGLTKGYVACNIGTGTLKRKRRGNNKREGGLYGALTLGWGKLLRGGGHEGGEEENSLKENGFSKRVEKKAVIYIKSLARAS